MLQAKFILELVKGNLSWIHLAIHLGLALCSPYDVDRLPVDLVVRPPVRVAGEAKQDAADRPVLRVEPEQGQQRGTAG